jgi:hypothetical protein
MFYFRCKEFGKDIMVSFPVADILHIRTGDEPETSVILVRAYSAERLGSVVETWGSYEDVATLLNRFNRIYARVR